MQRLFRRPARASAATCRTSVLLCAVAAATSACSAPPAEAPPPKASGVYNAATGQLEQLVSDRNGDGKVDTWAHMSGGRVTAIDIDRDGDGRPDRWEHYGAPAAAAGAAPAASPAPGAPANLIVSAEEADRTGKIVRREFYLAGVISRVEEDTDLDGRVDKWEFYSGGQLTHVDLDLSGRGTPDQRLVYGADGGIDHVERDVKGDGKFERIREGADASAGSSTAGKTTPGRKGGG